MERYTRRVHVGLTEQEYQALLATAGEQGLSLSGSIRKALDEHYFHDQRTTIASKALEELLPLNAPESDWEIMEDEIIQAAST